MRQVDYVRLIAEDADTLFAREKASSGHKARQRLQLLRLLKTGEAETMGHAARLIGMSKDHAAKLFQRYRREGLEGYVECRYRGRRCSLNSEQEHHLCSEAAPPFATLSDGQRWIEQQYQVRYTISGVSVLFARLKIKKKTGRTRHVKHDMAVQQAFQKNL